MESRTLELTTAFKEAPVATQDRIQKAMDTMKEGKKREAIVQLKMVDADTALDRDQHTSLRNMIIQIRK